MRGQSTFGAVSRCCPTAPLYAVPEMVTHRRLSVPIALRAAARIGVGIEVAWRQRLLRRDGPFRPAPRGRRGQREPRTVWPYGLLMQGLTVSSRVAADASPSTPAAASDLEAGERRRSVGGLILVFAPE